MLLNKFRMNKANFFTILLFLYFSSYGQNINKVEVYYSYLLDFSNAPEYKINSRLIADAQSSIFEMDHIGKLETEFTITNETENNEFSNNTNIVVPSEENEYVYKNFIENVVNYSDVISFKEFFILEQIPKLNWSLTQEKKALLGYECFKATTLFRGRKYEAFYTTDIAISNGPWLFHGLPGLILEINCIEANDLKFKIQAYSIKQLKVDNFEIDNPYQKKGKISWDDFLGLYQKKYDQTIRDNMTPNGPGYSLVKKSIMTYIED